MSHFLAVLNHSAMDEFKGMIDETADAVSNKALSSSTKELAIEKGIFRMRRPASASQAVRRRLPKQRFRYLLALDFESTCWRDESERNGASQEIIEFPVVLCAVDGGNEISGGDAGIGGLTRG